MTVSSLVKGVAIRYAMVATAGGALLVGCVLCAAFVWQKLDNRSREGNQEQIDATYAKPAQEAFRRGDVGEYERLMRQYHDANERNYSE